MAAGDSGRHSWFSAERLAAAGLLLLTLLVRGGLLWAMRDKLADDPDAYREIAENLLQHGVYGLGKEGEPTPTAYRPPLYPIVLSNLPARDKVHVSLVKVAVLHVLLGVATVWLTYLTARRLLAREAGPEDRQEIAPTVRSGIERDDVPSLSSEGPTPVDAKASAGPSGLIGRILGWSQTPTSRSGLLPIGPPGPVWAPFLTALLVACDPILLNQQALVMTETLAAFLAILSLWLLARFDAGRDWFNAGLAGGAMALAALCRPTFLPWLGLLALGMMLVRPGNCKLQIANCKLAEGKRGVWVGFGWRLANVTALAVMAAGVMSPWVIRNQRVFGKPILTTTHGGYTLALGNNEYFYRWLRESPGDTPWDSASLDQRLRTELYWGPLHLGPLFDEERILDKFFYYERAKRSIREEPRMFLIAASYRIRQLWSPLPYKLSADESTGRMLLRVATAAWYCGVYLLAAIGMWRLRWQLVRPPWVWGVLLCLTFTAVHILYWCNLRMRAPLMPFVVMVVGAAFVGQPSRLSSATTSQDAAGS